MKQRKLLLLFGLGFFLSLLFLTDLKAQPAQAKNVEQKIVHRAAPATGVAWANESESFPFPMPGLAESPWFSIDGKFLRAEGAFSGPAQANPCAGLTPEKIRAGGVTVLQCKLHCESILPAGSEIKNRSDEELWACINGSGGQPGDQPGGDVPIIPEDPLPPEPEPPVVPNDTCAGVTPYDFRVGSQESLVCRLLCEESYYQSDEELWTCIEYYGGQPGGDIPTIPDDPPGSDQPESLGPLATTPFVPLTGALIGTVVGWLVSVAVTSGNVLKTLTAPPLQPARPPASVVDPKTIGTPVAQTPITPTDIQPPVPPTDAPKSGAEQLWDLATNLVGSSATVTGSLSEFFDFQDDAETVKKIRDSLQAWKNNPTKDAADAYFKNLRSLTRQNAVLEKAGKLLGNAANVMDGVDAVAKGLKKASERGYTGSDKVLAVGAEVSKKALNYALTKNPVAGLVNAAVGGITEMAYGKAGRVDISAVIDQGADAWDKTTQEYAGYTGGDWFAPTNENFGEVLANDPEIRRKDQYLHGVRQIKKLVEQGKLSLQEGGARIRHLRDTLLGGE
jgi:hypothetical protein